MIFLRRNAFRGGISQVFPPVLIPAYFPLLIHCMRYTYRLMIKFTEDTEEEDWKGYVYAAMLFVTAVVQSLLLHQYFHRCFVVGMRVRTAIISAVYSKVGVVCMWG